MGIGFATNEGMMKWKAKFDKKQSGIYIHI